MAAIDKMNKAKLNKNNEYYTLYENIQYIVENSEIKEYLSGKTVYLNCDTENSNIFKYLTDNKEKLNIKEILRTSDDYYKHIDLYEKCDIVFTNPPFIGLRKYIRWMNDNNYKFILFYPRMQLQAKHGGQDSIVKDCKFILQLLDKGRYFSNEKEEKISLEGRNDLTEFETPEGKLKSVAHYIISNDNYFKNYIHIGQAFQKSFNECKDKMFKAPDGNYVIDHCRYIPNDYFDPIYIPATAYIDRKDKFEYIKGDKIICPDGKYRFRILVKINK